jgi:hypothetical protein
MPTRTLLSALIVAGTGCIGAAPDLSPSVAPSVDPSAFVLPMLTTAQRTQIIHEYPQIDPTAEIPRGLLEDAILYFDVNKALIPQTTYFVVVDLSQYSGHDRFWLVDLASGAVEKHMVAHGAGSDPNNDGYATLFSNTSKSNMSSLGFFLTGEIYDGTHPHSMRIDGLSPDGSPNGMANTNVRDRDVVVHEADYVSDSNTDQQGRSDGCFALDPDIELSMVDRITGGTLMYAATSPLNNPPIGPGVCGDGVCDDGETSTSCPQDCGPCGTVDPTNGIIIDNGDACFQQGGPSAYLRSVTTAGYQDNLVWTHTTDDATESNYATWNLYFAAAGTYKVEAYTDTAYAQSKQAKYVITGATSQTATLDQTAADGWQTIGDFTFDQGGSQSIHLGDNTGEPNSAMTQLVFDAIRLTPAGS